MAVKGKNIIKIANTHDIANTGDEIIRLLVFVIVFNNTDLLLFCCKNPGLEINN